MRATIWGRADNIDLETSPSPPVQGNPLTAEGNSILWQSYQPVNTTVQYVRHSVSGVETTLLNSVNRLFGELPITSASTCNPQDDLLQHQCSELNHSCQFSRIREPTR